MLLERITSFNMDMPMIAPVQKKAMTHDGQQLQRSTNPFVPIGAVTHGTLTKVETAAAKNHVLAGDRFKAGMRHLRTTMGIRSSQLKMKAPPMKPNSM